MTPIQFRILMDAMDELRSAAAAVQRRLLRVEIAIATFTGGLILLAFLINAGIIKLS